MPSAQDLTTEDHKAWLVAFADAMDRPGAEEKAFFAHHRADRRHSDAYLLKSKPQYDLISLEDRLGATVNLIICSKENGSASKPMQNCQQVFSAT